MKGSVKEAHLSIWERSLRAFSYVLVHVVQRPKLMAPKPKLEEPTIFVCRHLGLMDPVVVMVEYYRMMIRPLVARDYVEKNRFTKAFYPFAQCITLDRHNTSSQWLKDSLAALGKGESVLIFPEGRRNKSGVGLLPFQSGAALLAARSGAQLIPVYHAPWKFPHRYRLAIGEPFRLTQPPEGKESAQWLKEQTEIIQAKVAVLAPLVESE